MAYNALMMTFDKYREDIKKFDLYPNEASGLFSILGMIEELGEMKIKKITRDDKGKITKERRDQLLYEIGDFMWYMAKAVNTHTQDNVKLDRITRSILNIVVQLGVMANSYLGYNNIRSVSIIEIQRHITNICLELDVLPEKVMQMNIEKLKDRKIRGKIKGDGDKR